MVHVRSPAALARRLARAKARGFVVASPSNANAQIHISQAGCSQPPMFAAPVVPCAGAENDVASLVRKLLQGQNQADAKLSSIGDTAIASSREVAALRDNVLDIRAAVGPLADAVAVQQAELADLRAQLVELAEMRKKVEEIEVVRGRMEAFESALALAPMTPPSCPPSFSASTPTKRVTPYKSANFAKN